LPRKERPVAKAYLEPVEIERLEEAARYLRDRLLIRLLFRLGCRISEALGIRVSDIDFARGTVTIEHLKTRVKLACPNCGAGLSRSSRFCPSCGREVGKAVAEGKEQRRFRALPIDDGTAAMLKEYVKRGGPVSRNSSSLLFGISRHRAWQIVMRCAEKAKLPRLVNSQSGKPHNVSPHRLRDAFAVMAVKLDDSGDGLRMLQEHLGHQSITTTMRYRKVSGEEQKEWYERLWNGGNGNG
jgi:integrase/recombinase XerD